MQSLNISPLDTGDHGKYTNHTLDFFSKTLRKGRDSNVLERILGYFVLFCSCGTGTVAGAGVIIVNGGFRPAFSAAVQ